MLSRRAFVAWVASAVPITLVARRADALGANWIADDDATMRSLAEAILPSELGADGAAKVARDFQRWIDGYRENAELVHGYGTSALSFAAASPRAKWAAQIETLRRGNFNHNSVAQRRTTIDKALAGEKLDRIPDVADASHVAVGLLAFFYSSSAANDLCYQARIGRETCRPLAAQSRAPLPLADRPRTARPPSTDRSREARPPRTL
ncbi:MAG TPA: hypothetical protein VKH19_17605 [Gemmatimonadaceae bacterium]|nr:hypothetical protein [Gemmatimonadaceae bacterium]